MKPAILRQKAIKYRKLGYSYNLISLKLNLNKSTLAYWLKDVDYKPNKQVLSRMKQNLKKFALYNQQKSLRRIKERAQIRKRAAKEIKSISKKELLTIGAAIYLAEGNKKNREVRVTNSDPRIIQIVIRWLIQTCGVGPSDLQARVHIYPDNNESKSIKYWSKISGIPKTQFQKTQIDRRIKMSKYKKSMLPFGTVHLRVRRSTDLFYRIMGWTDGMLN